MSEVFITPAWVIALVVKQGQDTEGLLSFDEIQNVLVVRKVNERPFNAFPGVLFLFKLKNIIVEVLLQFFVRVVDAQLLQRVFIET